MAPTVQPTPHPCPQRSSRAAENSHCGQPWLGCSPQGAAAPRAAHAASRFTNVVADHTIDATFGAVTAVVAPPARFALGPVVPNPTRGELQVPFGLPRPRTCASRSSICRAASWRFWPRVVFRPDGISRLGTDAPREVRRARGCTSCATGWRDRPRCASSCSRADQRRFRIKPRCPPGGLARGVAGAATGPPRGVRPPAARSPGAVGS